MDFKAQINGIKNYIESNLPEVLKSANLSNFDAYIDDFLDFDLYTKSNQLFYDFGFYNFEDLSNESNQGDFEFSVQLAFRNDTPANLNSKMLEYAAAFYKMFEDSGKNFGGVFDFGKITASSFYRFVEGKKGIKLVELTMHLGFED